MYTVDSPLSSAKVEQFPFGGRGLVNGEDEEEQEAVHRRGGTTRRARVGSGNNLSPP